MASSATPHLSLLLLFLSSITTAQNNQTQIPIGAFLIAGNTSSKPWLSSSNDFAFGFQSINNNSNLFLLSIWFHKIPESTTIWFAKKNRSPILSPKGSKLELTASNGLILRNPQNQETWKSEPLAGVSVAGGIITDAGNFLLINGTNGSVWESFKNPTDTLVPTQKLEINGVLSSRNSPFNYSNGRFQFRLLEDGNAILNTINIVTGGRYDAYYISGTRDDQRNLQNSGFEVVFDESGFLYVLKRNGVQVNITGFDGAYPVESYYYRVVMNFDGVLTVSTYAKSRGIGDGGWKDLQRIPGNICLSNTNPITRLGSGTCGYNSICTLKSDGRPSCNCPEGYSLIDPNDEYGSCKLNIPHSCDEQVGGNSSAAGLYQMVGFQNSDWPMRDLEQFGSFNEEECKLSCLEDCLCMAVAFGNRGCWKKGSPLSNGRKDASLRSVAYLKLRKNTTFEHLSKRGQKNNEATIIVALSVLLGSSVFVIFILVGLKWFSFLLFFSKKKVLSETPACNLFWFTYKDLEKATENFKKELGRGSCGIVYKGIIQTGPIAVKRLDRKFEDREKEFRTEVNVIGQTHHKNLVRLLGYCEEGNNRILVYQFMSNGTLSSFLFNNSDDLKPSWKLRTQMAYGIARGLSYLHEECNTQIIHCDIKPQNILLDDDFNAKISDFGLAKLLKMDQSKTETGIRGTKGYVAPDWFRSSPVNAKVDVYSFGVLLLEIICCRRNVVVDIEGGEERVILTDWAYDCYQEGRLEVLIEGDKEAMDDFDRVERFVKVAIWCVQEEPSKRPTMKKAMLMLEGSLDVLVPPCPYPFSSLV